MDNEKKRFNKKRITSKQIVAWIGIIGLIALYVVTLLVALFDTSSGNLFAACLYATVAVPLLVWIYSWLYQKYTARKEADPFSSPDGQDVSDTADRLNQTESRQP